MKRTAFKKKSKRPKRKLADDLWDAMRFYIYARDKGVCITCDKTGLTGSNRHAGHFIPSSVGGFALRYNEKNVFVQCLDCNYNRGGWGERYAEVLEERFGRKYVQELRALKTQIVKDFDYEFWTKYYQKKLAALNK